MMTSGFSLIILVTLAVLNNVFADDDSHHHHVIIHVPYKIHTIHHTILKHIHHQKKSDEGDKYEVLGYTIGKPIDLSHHLGGAPLHYEPPLPPPPPPPPLPLHHHEPPSPPMYHHQHHPHPEEMQHQEFIGGNELGYGHEWEPSFGNEFHGGGYQPSGLHYENHEHFVGGHHEFPGHHESFHHGGYN